MAKRKINKSAKIREVFEKLGADARPKDVVAALAAQKVKVSAAQVSNLKAKLGKPSERGGRGRKADGDLFALSDLQAAKKLVEQLGSLERVERAIEALAKLR